MTMGLFDKTLQYINPKSAYFTPGLWDKEGIEFLTAFLFETPLALLRFSSPWFIMICGTAFALTYVKYKKELRKWRDTLSFDPAKGHYYVQLYSGISTAHLNYSLGMSIGNLTDIPHEKRLL